MYTYIYIDSELKYDQVLYGLMRLSFGEGRFRRSHWVFFIWTPDTMVTSTPPNIRSKKNVERMKHVSWQPQMQDMLKPFGVTIVSETLEKVALFFNFEKYAITKRTQKILYYWIGRVKKSVVVDGSDTISEEAFMKALEAEKAYFAQIKKKESEETKRLQHEMQVEEEHRREKEAERKRKEREERLRQRSLYNKAQLTKIDSNEPTAIEEEPEEDDEEKAILSADEEEEREEIIVPPPVQIDEIPAVIEVKLSEEELAKIEAERKHQEEEERKRQEKLQALEKEALMSKLIMESVELCKRINEPLDWVLKTNKKKLNRFIWIVGKCFLYRYFFFAKIFKLCIFFNIHFFIERLLFIYAVTKEVVAIIKNYAVV
ncbi:hypothetical protein RFI_20511 [Reticulomyxa filosa]|uniref:ADF-H domain-containing protein n=1 Tax=Reticulomyxa filosa TaxID=46433 RepID=X6MT50_RETFI|nr:hypothetical protein RFI_20511 [Reticulomyxa filosa]|eukprot:ETO16826.1 hypothetical protein RFI_20511 [Reticulomyxa filosa]